MIRRFAFLFVVLWIVGGIAFIFFYGKHLQNQPLLKLGQVPAFELVERSGAAFHSSELMGKVWIADFIFTSCGGPCPMMSAVMSRMAAQLKNVPQIYFVSFSVDPEHDTPERLSQYAALYEADPERWKFLTGEKTKIYDLAMQHFHLASGNTLTNSPDPSHMILHSTKFVLIDQQGQIRGYYDSFEPNQLKKLALDAQRLAKTSPSHAAA